MAPEHIPDFAEIQSALFDLSNQLKQMLVQDRKARPLDLQRLVSRLDLLLRDMQVSPSHVSAATEVASRPASAAVIAALRESETRFQLAIGIAPIAVFTTDLNLRYTWIYSPYMGPVSQTFVGKRDEEILDPESAQQLIEIKLRALHERNAQHAEVHLHNPHVNRFLLVSIQPQFEASSAISGLIGAALDITEQRLLRAQQIHYATQVEVHRRLLEQREMERQQLARELHDGPLQELGGLIFAIQLAENICPDPDMAARVHQLGEDAKHLSQELRQVCNELRPPVLSRFGLLRAIQSHVEEFTNRHPHIRLDLELLGEDRRVPDKIGLAVFRICQEALNNVARHSEANQVILRAEVLPEIIELSVEDNGRGFVPQNDWIELARQGHLGLVGMKERAEAVGGRLAVISQPGQGCVINVEVPWQVKMPGEAGSQPI